MKRKDLTGKRFGRLTVIEYVGTKYDKNGGNAKAQWKCKCDCGNIRVVNSASLLLGRSKSCGCLCREINSKRMKKMIKDNGCYIKRLQEQLAIATKALKGVSLWANTGNGGEKAVKKVCEKALKEIEEDK